MNKLIILIIGTILLSNFVAAEQFFTRDITQCTDTNHDGVDACNNTIDGIVDTVSFFWTKDAGDGDVKLTYYLDGGVHTINETKVYLASTWWNCGSSVELIDFGFYISSDNITFSECATYSSQCDVASGNQSFDLGESCTGSTFLMNTTLRGSDGGRITEIYWFGYNYTPQTGDITIALNSPIDDTYTNNATLNLDYNINYSISPLTSCSLWTNSSGTWELNQSNTTAIINTSLNEFTNLVFPDGTYIWNVNCYNDSFWGANNFTLTVDRTNPTISTDLSTNDRFAFHPKNLTAWINISDENLYSLLVNDSSGVLVNVTGITTDSYNYSLELDTSSYVSGIHNLTVTFADGHTTNSIGIWEYEKNFITEEIVFDFSDVWYELKYLSIKPKNPGIFDSFTTEKEESKYLFVYDTSPGTTSISFVVRSSDYIDIIDYRPNAGYNAWLVMPNLKKWTDFNIVDATGKEVYKVERVSPNEVEVIISNLDGRPKIVFSSSGNLNVVTKVYNWYLINATETFETGTIERITTDFTLNISKINNTISTEAIFFYNGTLSATTKTSTSGYDYYNVSVENVRLDSDRFLDIPFNWTINISSQSQNTTYKINNTQQVYQIILEDCGENITINYSILSEETELPIQDYSFDGSYHLWDRRNTNFVRNFSFSNTTLNTSNQLCLSPGFGNFSTNYQALFDSEGYDSSNLIVSGGVFNRTTQTKKIYLTNTSTEIVVSIIDENDDALEDYTIEVERYDFVNGVYLSIDTERTDWNGEVLFNLDVVDKEYRFIIKNTLGVVVYTSTKQKLISTSYLFQIILGTTQEHIDLKISYLDINLEADRTTKTFNLTWNNINTALSDISFRVYKTNTTNDVLVYNITSTNNSGSFNYSINYNASTTESATYIGGVYGTSTDDLEEHFIKSETIDIRLAWDIFGTESLVVAFLLVSSLMFIGAALSPEAAILLSIVSIIICFAAGFIVVGLSSVISLIVGFIILLVKIKRGYQ